MDAGVVPVPYTREVIVPEAVIRTVVFYCFITSRQGSRGSNCRLKDPYTSHLRIERFQMIFYA